MQSVLRLTAIGDMLRYIAHVILFDTLCRGDNIEILLNRAV